MKSSGRALFLTRLAVGDYPLFSKGARRNIHGLPNPSGGDGLSSGVAIGEEFVNKGLEFYFKPESEQDDLEKNKYGTACAHPNFSMRIISQLVGMHLSEYKQGLWWEGTQDVYVLVKKSVRKRRLLLAFRRFVRRSLSVIADCTFLKR